MSARVSSGSAVSLTKLRCDAMRSAAWKRGPVVLALVPVLLLALVLVLALVLALVLVLVILMLVFGIARAIG